MKTKFSWEGLTLILTIVLAVTGGKLIENSIYLLNSNGANSESNHYYTEVGIRAEYIRAKCRKVCMDGFSSVKANLILPTGDTLKGPLTDESFDECIVICNEHSELSPEFIALERSHMQTALDMGQKKVVKLSNKFIIMAYFPLFVWDIVVPLMVPSDPPLGGGDCGLSTCLGHVHITRTSQVDNYFRVITPVPNSTITAYMAIEDDSGNVLKDLVTEPTYLTGGYRQSKIAWNQLCSPSLEMQSLKLRVTRYSISGDSTINITWTPIWFNLICSGE